uniref:Uncharacterized protein n=1 Tax=Rhizophora mucronata TaxID=61149 RepID=A0A2P2NQU0_RHIMU
MKTSLCMIISNVYQFVIQRGFFISSVGI